MSSDGAPSAGPAIGIWTGEEVLVYGRGLAAYHPPTDTWRPVESPGGMGGGSPVWAGRAALAWWNFSRRQYRGGSAFDPATGDWTELPRRGAPSFRGFESVVWADDRLIVWGGEGCETDRTCDDGAMLLDW